MKAVAARIGRDALTAAADAGVDVDLDGDRGSARVRELDGAQLAFVKTGKRWRIAGGHSLQP